MALRWKSFFAGVIPVAVLIGKLFGYDFTPEALNELNEIFVNVILGLWAAVAGVAQINGWANRNFRKQHRIGAFAKNTNPIA